MRDLSGRKVAILVVDGFEQVELTSPREALEKAGATCEIVSTKKGTVQGFHHDEKADRFEVDRTFDQARPDDYDAVLLPGGVMNADDLRMKESAREFVRAMDRAGKPVAVICHAPWLLVSAGLVDGRHITSYHTLQDDLRNAGAEWTDDETVVDRNWLSSRNPDDLPAFNREMVKLFASSSDRRAADEAQRDETRV